MRHDQSQRIAMVGTEGLAVMMRGKEHIVTIKVDQGDVGGETLFGMNKYVLCFRLQLYQLKNFLKCDALPVIVKAAPARDAMKIAVRLHPGKCVKFLPLEAHRLFHQTSNMEIPPRGISIFEVW